MSRYNKKLRTTRRKRHQRFREQGTISSAQADVYQDSWNRAMRAVAKMRTEGLSLKKAAREAGVSPRRVVRFGGRAIKKGANGRHSITRRDSLLRVMQVPTPDGSRDVALRTSRHASTLGQYWEAVHKYLRPGDASKILKFRGKRIKDANGVDIPLFQA